MKKVYFIAICFLLSSKFYSQDTKIDYKTDTVQGRHFGDFIKPIDSDGTIFKENENKESVYFKKCQYLKISDERNKCFSETFYEVLRKNISFHNEHLKGKEIDLVVKFTISKSGKIVDISFPKSNDSSGEFEKEIIRVLGKLPKIIPAKVNNQFVDSTYKFPIKFTNK